MSSVSLITCLLVMVVLQYTQYGGVSGAITEVTPPGIILSGGIEMTVTGTGLDVGTTTPKIVITATYLTNTFTFTGADCTVVTATSLTCPSPEIDTTTITGYTIPPAKNQRLLNDVDFTIGVVWSTGTENHGSVNVYKDPDVTMKDSARTFSVWTNTLIVFYGLELNSYISVMSDYQVSIGNLDCPVTYINSTWMSCNIPTVIPERENVEDISPVVMSIGNFQQQQLGTLHYRVPVFTDATDEFQLFDPTDLAHRVTVSGHYLMVGLNHSSYRVQIGIGECSDIVVSTTSLSCRPPGTAPAPLAGYPLMGQLPQMVITVPKDSSEAVFRYIYHVTYIKYGETTDENAPGLPSDGQVTEAPADNGDNGSEGGSSGGNDGSDSWKWIVVGVCAFVGVTFLTVLFCCLCCSDLCPIGKQRMRWVEKEPFYRVETDSTNRTPRSSIHSYPTRTSGSSTYPTPSRLYHITQQLQRH